MRIYTFCFKFLVVYSAKHREYQLVAKSTVPFFNSCYFHNVDFFRWYAPAVPRNWGHNANSGAMIKIPPTSKPCRRL